MMAASYGRFLRQVPGFEKYQVDSDGRVFNADGNQMAQRIDRYGYAEVRLSKDGKQAHKKVSRIVCEAFHGPPLKGQHAAHLDGDKLNNTPANLAWKSPAENNADKLRHGTAQTGEKHPRSRLSATDIAAIREASASSRNLARQYRVSQSHIVRIKNGDRW